MSNYNELVGLPYIDGRQDCYSVIRRYFALNWGIDLPNLARPNRFWDDPAMDLYQNYTMTGFQPVMEHVYEIGDVVLMPVLSSFNNHAGVVVEDNLMLHHLPNQLSSLDQLRPRWANRVMVHLRHPEVTKPTQEVVHLHEVIDADILRNPGLQKEIERAVGSDRRTVRRDHL